MLPDGTQPGAGEDELASALAAVFGQLIRLLRRLAPADVGPGSLAALATLSRHGPMRLGDLAGREGLAPPTVTRMVAVLEQAGYVSRQVDPSDRRAVQVSVTQAGARVVTQAAVARSQVLAARLAMLPRAQRRSLAAALPALQALADDGG